MSLFKKISSGVVSQKTQNQQADRYRVLMRAEARIGGQLFGPVAPGVRREFFCLDEHTWVWHEEWTERGGKKRSKMTRYDVRPNGILKAQGGQYSPVSLAEANNLRDAVTQYEQRIRNELYPGVA